MLKVPSKNLTKREIVDCLSRRSTASKKEIRQVLDLFLEAVAAALREGTEVRVTPLGTFAVKCRKAGRIRNPKTGEPLFIPEKRVPVFRPGKLLRQALR